MVGHNYASLIFLHVNLLVFLHNSKDLETAVIEVGTAGASMMVVFVSNRLEEGTKNLVARAYCDHVVVLYCDHVVVFKEVLNHMIINIKEDSLANIASALT